jgi:tetratricopeptide (TPR) repeat protein
MIKPLCFVLMPFGKKPDATGQIIDFDAVYLELIAPAIEKAGMEPLRADEEQTGGIIHKPMFERLVLCEYAVADLTTANANVFYELGVRHAVRPWSTVILFANNTRLPFDVAPLRGIPYQLGENGLPAHPDDDGKLIHDQLRAAREGNTDSPVFQLVSGMQPPDIASDATDVFRKQVEYSSQIKQQLADARGKGLDAVTQIEQQLAPIADAESGVIIDLFLSYRAVKGWEGMIALVGKMSRPLAQTVLVQEQLAFALNRNNQGEQAEKVLTELLENRGGSSETYGLLGRVYKDRWEMAKKKGDTSTARGILKKAINAYLKGFETDCRDAYPGINAITLMELQQPPDPRRVQLIPVVSYAAERQISFGKADYWDYATQLELAFLAKDKQKAEDVLDDVMAHVREGWEPETTARNLRLICEARKSRNELEPWMQEVQQMLDDKSKREQHGLKG